MWSDYRTALVRIEVSGRDSSGTPVTVRQGTGVIVSPNGTIVTALHVVGSASDWYRNPDSSLDRGLALYRLDDNNIEQKIGGAAVHEVPEYDIAILTTNAINLKNVTIASVRVPDFSTVAILPWDPVTRIAKPVTGDLTITNREIYGDRLTIMMHAIGGHSGAPVFNASLQLVGIITNRIDTDRALAVPADLFASRLPGFSALQPDPADAAAQFNLAWSYENGSAGRRKDDREAARLYALAADKGYAPAQVILGFFYESGRGGLLKDEGKAESLYKRAADQGDAYTQITTVFELAGTWVLIGDAGGRPGQGPKISRSGNALTVDMSAYSRRPASGSVIDARTIILTFSDTGSTHAGRLRPPGTIGWSNGTWWTKLTGSAIPVE